MMDFHELVMRYALRKNYMRVARTIMASSLPDAMHLEFAFFIMKHIISQRNYVNYSIVSDLTKHLTQYDLRSTARECVLYRIGCAVAFIVLMNELIATKDNPQGKFHTISRIFEVFPTTGKFEKLDAEIRKSRVALLSVSMKESRMLRLEREFNNRAEKMSVQIEQHLDMLRAELLPPLQELPVKDWLQSNIPEQVVLAKIIAENGAEEESLMNYFEIVHNTPDLSANFFHSSSADIFSEKEEEKSIRVIID